MPCHHIHALGQLLGRRRKHGLTAKPSKFEIRHADVDLLGHVVGGGSIRPQCKRMDKIMDTRKPETKKELRSFLGTIIRKSLTGMVERERNGQVG